MIAANFQLPTLAEPAIEEDRLSVQSSQSENVYVLMNIPYDKFYEAEIGEGDLNVDAVTSATYAKPRTGSLAGGSYHVNSDGSDITEVIYPVKVNDISILDGYHEVTDEDSVSITTTNRGTTSTTVYEGKESLFENESYSYYKLEEEPEAYKEIKLENGEVSFGEVVGEYSDGDAELTVKNGGSHTDVEVTLSGLGEVEDYNVSAVIITTADGNRYPLRHIQNIWRKTELGWNLNEFDLAGKTITNIRYINQKGVYDFATETKIADSRYVLMNIPYNEFYKAELNEDSDEVDAVTSATLNKPRTGSLAGGSYHVNPDGTDITGIIYPVYVEDSAILDNFKKIDDSESVSITVKNRGVETTTSYNGAKALFEQPSYTYYELSEKPSKKKVLTVDEEGNKSFGAISGRASTISGVEGEMTVNARHADIEIALSNTGSVSAGDVISGVVLTTDKGKKYGLTHIKNIWRAVELGWNAEDNDISGNTITNIRYIKQDAVYDMPVSISVNVASEEVPDNEEAVSDDKAPVSDEISSGNGSESENGVPDDAEETPSGNKTTSENQTLSDNDIPSDDETASGNETPSENNTASGNETPSENNTASDKTDDEKKERLYVAAGKYDISSKFEAYTNSGIKYKFVSKNKKIASVTGKGVLKPKRTGTVTIELKARTDKKWSVVSSCSISVVKPSMQKKISRTVGDAGFKANSLFTDTEIDYTPDKWISSNEKVATVAEDGTVTIVGKGKTNIIVQFGEGKNSSKKKYKTKLVVS